MAQYELDFVASQAADSIHYQDNPASLAAGDSIQFAGPILKTEQVSQVAIVGGTGKFAGCRGEARTTVSMSDNDTPLFEYHITITT
jgi:hypothetical protein